ncbi:hypothetical protein [Pedobacter sp.]|uniref:hypothetical protein n=1 Tax=Pedobacter sp. TaxID=1411316 RepID=UPI0031DF82DB
MKVLYISKDKQANKSEALSWFKRYCEHETDLIIKTTFDSAKQFLADDIIDDNKHIDFIITDWQIKGDNAKSLLNWIRESEHNYSNDSFQFRSLPVLLIEDEKNQSSTISDGFNETVVDFPTNKYQLRNSIKNAVKNWRYSLANDLDLIGLDPKTQKSYDGHRAKFISYYKLTVLSRVFVDSKTDRLNYIWTNSNITMLSDANQAFEDKINWAKRSSDRNIEKIFHQFFIKNPTLIKGEDYLTTRDRLHYEKQFYKDATRRDIPDFMNEPYSYSFNKPEVFEIKRQTQRILRYDKTGFLSNAKSSFKQVDRYRRYMQSDNPLHQQYIIRHLGKLYPSFKYTLLMGSLEEKMENEDLIEKLKSDFNFEDIGLVTYEELLQQHIRLCDRLTNFNIF